MQKIIWTLVIILIGIGFVPYKFPVDADKMTSDQILVRPQESTCTPSLRVVKGSLHIPDNLKGLIDNFSDLSTTGDNTPSTHLDNGNGDVVLYLNNNYILSGKVIGYDTAFYKMCGKHCALYKVSDWSPTTYNENFWTFSINFVIIYFLSLFALIITGVILLVISLVNKSRRKKAEPGRETR